MLETALSQSLIYTSAVMTALFIYTKAGKHNYRKVKRRKFRGVDLA